MDIFFGILGKRFFGQSSIDALTVCASIPSDLQVITESLLLPYPQFSKALNQRLPASGGSRE
jgi:hypothetical protein